MIENKEVGAKLAEMEKNKRISINTGTIPNPGKWRQTVFIWHHYDTDAAKTYRRNQQPGVQ
jgi:uncharacterized protein YjlB